MYLRILKAIDEEVVDRDVIRSAQVSIFKSLVTLISSQLNLGKSLS